MNNQLIALLLASSNKNVFMIIAVITVIIVIVLIIKAMYRKATAPRYHSKNLLTNTESRYFDILRVVLDNDYLVFPQINLASVIDKVSSDTNFRNELFRNIDFGVFDFNYKPLLLIEINDETHQRADRAERDSRVAEICKKANIPLLVLWVKDGIDPRFIKSELSKYLKI